ncbi:hypothetical protein ACFC58_34545 [Kitasatospora purpeofusca]|uniref:hypothetical protein n=1 Tax=Kitasatospora purpeofusca TaxID=67352 RepID=UPI0035E0708A
MTATTRPPVLSAAGARSAFAAALAREPGVHDPAIVAALTWVPRHQLMPRLFAPLGEERPVRRWRLLDLGEESEQHVAVCHATALLPREEHGALSGQLTAERWGHVPDRAAGWIPLPQAPPDGGRSRRAVLVPPTSAERGFWVALGHALPGVRRHWGAPGFEDEVVLVASDRSRAAVAPNGSRAVEWGPRNLWQEAEELHARWDEAGRPAEYRLELHHTGLLAIGGPGLSWQLPME